MIEDEEDVVLLMNVDRQLNFNLYRIKRVALTSLNMMLNIITCLLICCLSWLKSSQFRQSTSRGQYLHIL